MSIPIYMVEGCAAGRMGLANVALPVEAHDERDAIVRALEVLRARGLTPVGLKSHRCCETEHELDRWVRYVLAQAFGKTCRDT